MTKKQIMPKNLIIVRHGQSEGNIANRKSRRGDHSAFENDDFAKRDSSHYRLTDLGVIQAQKADEYIKTLGLDFWRHYSSNFLRARETAALLDMPDSNWYLSNELVERSWGDLDAMSDPERKLKFGDALNKRHQEAWFWRPPQGESLAGVSTRVRDILGTIHRESEGDNCVIVCHGETMSVIRSDLERWTPQDFAKNFKNEAEDIGNCSVLHYSRTDPKSGAESEYLSWVRLVSVAGDGANFDWRKIERKTFSSKALLESLVEYPRIINR